MPCCAALVAAFAVAPEWRCTWWRITLSSLCTQLPTGSPAAPLPAQPAALLGQLGAVPGPAGGAGGLPAGGLWLRLRLQAGETLQRWGGVPALAPPALAALPVWAAWCQAEQPSLAAPQATSVRARFSLPPRQTTQPPRPAAVHAQRLWPLLPPHPARLPGHDRLWLLRGCLPAQGGA